MPLWVAPASDRLQPQVSLRGAPVKLSMPASDECVEAVDDAAAVVVASGDAVDATPEAEAAANARAWACRVCAARPATAVLLPLDITFPTGVDLVRCLSWNACFRL